jgi:hypothetical protein
MFSSATVQPVAEEEAHPLEVDGRPRHELPGLVPVVEAEREPDEVRVHPAPHVHLDVEGLATGEDAPAEHQHRADDPEQHDRGDGFPEQPRVVVQQRLVDHVLAGHPDERDLRRLRPDREQARDDQAPAVRLQEREQAKERRAVSLLLYHP